MRFLRIEPNMATVSPSVQAVQDYTRATHTAEPDQPLTPSHTAGCEGILGRIDSDQESVRYSVETMLCPDHGFPAVESCGSSTRGLLTKSQCSPLFGHKPLTLNPNKPEPLVGTRSVSRNHSQAGTAPFDSPRPTPGLGCTHNSLKPCKVYPSRSAADP